jgi:hypothetical protein
MRSSVVWTVAALAAAVLFGATVVAQPPPGGRGQRGFGGFGGRGGFGTPLERAVTDLKLPEGKKDAALAAVRAYREQVNRLTDLAGARLMLKMKDVLSTEEFTALKAATDKSAAGPGGLRFGRLGGRGLTTDDIVDRLLSFDKNKDGKITKDELPERMQNLIAKGDTNKDGALDRDEIRTLAADLAKERSAFAGGFGRRDGFGGRAGAVALGGPAGGPTLRAIERAVDGLKLPEKKKEAASAAITAQREQDRKLTKLVRAELVLEMSDLLSAEQLTRFEATLNRLPGVGERPGGPPGFAFGRRGRQRP